MNNIQVDLGDSKYPVFIGTNIIDEFCGIYETVGGKGETYFIVDEFVYKKHQKCIDKQISKLHAKFFCLSAGKANKTFASAMCIFADLNFSNISRDSTIVAIGGGVIGDLAGFIASCWYRGVRLIHLPTTLLSAVDSCLGGKTAINFRDTVNAIGTYHHPIAIFIDTSILYDLPQREISSGFGEIIKYSVLGSSDITALIENDEDITVGILGQIIGYSLLTKQKFVKDDVRESKKRLSLNFGHTIGHAIEFSTIYNGIETLRHGEGVALGMVAIFRICIYLKMLREEDLDRLVRILKKYELPTSFNASSIGMNREDLIGKVVDLAFKDKKRTSDSLRLVIVKGWGNPDIYYTKDRNLIELGVNEVIL